MRENVKKGNVFAKKDSTGQTAAQKYANYQDMNAEMRVDASIRMENQSANASQDTKDHYVKQNFAHPIHVRMKENAQTVSQVVKKITNGTVFVKEGVEGSCAK